MTPNLRGAGIHIVHKGTLSWHVVHVVDSESTMVVERQMLKKVAVAKGRNLARGKKLELYIHGRNGKIQRRDSYGKESNKKDKR